MTPIRTCLLVSVGLAVAVATVPANAQGRLPEIPTVATGASPEQELQTQFATVREISSGVRDRIAEATRRLEDVAGASTSELEVTVSQMFGELRDEVNTIIQGTSSTSALRNALSRAREQALVFQQDLQRRPAEHPNRDQNLAALEAAISQYESLGGQLDERAEEAASALFQLSQQQNQIVEQIRLDQILRAQEALSEVVAGLTVLAESIGELEPPSFDGAVVN